MSTALESLLKTQRRRLVAHLARSLGLAHWALAEDAVQVAALRALQSWPAEGLPANPAGWLYRVARHHAIDVLRASDRHDVLPQDGEDLPPPLTVPAAEGRLAGELDDEELALLFAACHPALPLASQVALALRAMTSLELSALAECLFTSEQALAQRLARARAALKDEALNLPAGVELPGRLEAVLTTLQLMFAAGMKASGRLGTPQLRDGDGDRPGPAMMLCWEAIRLARAVAAHRITAHAEADALAALLLFHGARLTGRLDDAGDMVPLPGQPRDRWDAGLVRLGFAHLRASQRAERLSRHHLQAGIAAEHAMASDYAGTDWKAIAGYYELLVAIDPSPAPRLGHAVALAEAGSADEARRHLERLLPETPIALRAHTLAALSRAHERLGRQADAIHLLRQAIGAVQHEADARVLRRRLGTLEGLDGPKPPASM